ncbi:MAG: hypothetical protein AB8B85_18780 [Paracoccaceae bacterium]
MKAFLRAMLALCVLAACAAPPPAKRATEPLVEDPRLSALGPSKETSDQSCQAEADALDRALSSGRRDSALEVAFDNVASCRQNAAEALIMAYRSGRIAGDKAGATLIGMRGAMRRDVARLEGMLFNQSDSGALRSRMIAARNRQDALVLRGS